MPCLICNSPVEELHFGVRSCRACAAFYRRTIALNLDYKCRFEKNCSLSLEKKNRQSCRYCRFQQCLKVGMKQDEGIVIQNIDLTTDIPLINETIEVRFPYDEKFNSEGIKSVIGRLSSVNLHKLIQGIMKVRLDRIFEKTEPVRVLELSLPLTLCQQGLLGFREHNQRWPSCSKDKVLDHDDTIVDMDKFVRDAYAEVEYVAIFCMHIDAFALLEKDQKWLLYRPFYQRFHQLERTYVTGNIIEDNLEEEQHVTYSGIRFCLSDRFENLNTVTDLNFDSLSEFLKTTNAKSKKSFSDPMKKLKANEFEMVYMLLSCLFNKTNIDSRLSAETTNVLDTCNVRLSEDLHNYYVYEMKQANYADRVHKMSNIMAALNKIEECRLEDIEVAKTFKIFREDVYMSDLLFEKK